tara:strand:- start:517 stop:663 length:147 start_codon:yes stop_codon:yes gene_type:complete
VTFECDIYEQYKKQRRFYTASILKHDMRFKNHIYELEKLYLKEKNENL